MQPRHKAELIYDRHRCRISGQRDFVIKAAGAALIRVIDNGMVMSQIDANWFKFAVGALTIFAVVGNAWLRRRGRAMKVETNK